MSNILTQSWVQLIETPLPQALTNGTLHLDPALPIPGSQHMVYVGGTTSVQTTGINEVYSTQIQGDGNLRPWKVAGELPTIMAFQGAAMKGDWLYILNGTGGTPNTALYAVRLDEEGNFVGSPKDVGSMDAALSSPAVVVDGQWMYVLGGEDGAAFVISTGNLTRVVKLKYKSQTGNFTVGQVVTGGTSGATATISADQDNGTTGVLTLTAITGTYVDGEALTDPVTGAAVADGTQVGTVTATIAAGHNLVPGQVVVLSPGEANFAAGNKTITAVTPSTFSYSEVGQAANSTVPETFTASFATPRVRSVRLNGDGTVGTWQLLSDAQLPTGVYFTDAVVWDSFIFLIAGTTNAAADAVSSIWSARIMGNGQLAPWSKVSDLPVAVSRHAAVVWRDKLIVMGGQDTTGTNRADMWITTLQPSGQLGTWQTESLQLPVALRNVRCVSDGKRLYLASGFTTVRIADVYSLRVD